MNQSAIEISEGGSRPSGLAAMLRPEEIESFSSVRKTISESEPGIVAFYTTITVVTGAISVVWYWLYDWGYLHYALLPLCGLFLLFVVVSRFLAEDFVRVVTRRGTFELKAEEFHAAMLQPVSEVGCRSVRLEAAEVPSVARRDGSDADWAWLARQ